MEERLDENIKIEALAERVGLSTAALYSYFAKELHLTPGEYLMRQRIHIAKELLRKSDLNITSIAHRLGYSSSQYFATIFKKSTGVTPKQFRQGKR